MSELEPKYRRPLNTELVEILELLYKFRFVTISLLEDYFTETNSGMDVFRRLKTLESQAFIAKRYESSYRLLGKPAAYYLLPAGARKLTEYRDKDDTDEINIKGIYKDAIISEKFIEHCLRVLKLYNQLANQYGNALGFFSKTDQAVFEDFPKQKPDVYLTLEMKQNTKHFFIDILDDDTHLLIDASKKIKHYLDYRSSGDWVAVASKFPNVIFICSSGAAAKQVQKRCDMALTKAWADDVEFKVTTNNGIALQ